MQKVSEEESEQYFHSRPRGSQIGAIVSQQVDQFVNIILEIVSLILFSCNFLLFAHIICKHLSLAFP